MLKIGIYNKDHEVVVEPTGTKEGDLMLEEDEFEVYLGSRKIAYQEGDYIKLEVEKPNMYVWVKFDDTFEESLVYFKDVTEWIYKVPISELDKKAMKDTAFSGNGRHVYARLATEEEIYAYQNLARNRHASFKNEGVYPFAHANVETRNDPTFFARNAIDGIFANDDHGSYPYQSWGINQQDDAELTIEFGREVLVDRVGITLRADFPHDTWWKQVTLEFSDGSEEILDTIKTHRRQFFDIAERKITWVKMKNMIKGEEGPFPALTQIEVYGKNIR